MSRIVITIPTWNEALIIERTLTELCRSVEANLSSHDVLIEVADNASTDGTADMVDRHAGRPERTPFALTVTVSRLSGKGKGLAIRRSWERHLDADVLIFTDADLAADISFLPQLIQPILEGRADIVCGSRFAAGTKVERHWIRSLTSHLFRSWQLFMLGLPIQDAQCGFKAISSTAARRLLPECVEMGWLFDSELLALASQKGLKIVEIPVSWVEYRDPNRRSALRLLRDGWGFVFGIIKIRQRLAEK